MSAADLDDYGGTKWAQQGPGGVYQQPVPMMVYAQPHAHTLAHSHPLGNALSAPGGDRLAGPSQSDADVHVRGRRICAAQPSSMASSAPANFYRLGIPYRF